MGYKAGPSPQEVQLAEHAGMEAEQAELAEPAPQPRVLPLPQVGVEPGCHDKPCSARTEQEVRQESEEVAEEEQKVGGKEREESEMDRGVAGVVCASAEPSHHHPHPHPHPYPSTPAPLIVFHKSHPGCVKLTSATELRFTLPVIFSSFCHTTAWA